MNLCNVCEIYDICTVDSYIKKNGALHCVDFVPSGNRQISFEDLDEVDDGVLSSFGSC